jgi:propanol-preferring alcohol dehydrogenase
MNPFEAAPLSCAGVTTYKAVKVSGAGPSDLVAIFGVGGLGHLALQYALIAGAQVVAVDLFGEKSAMAKELGAAYTVNAGEQDPAATIRALGGADAAISLAVSPKALRRSSRHMARSGGAAPWSSSGCPPTITSSCPSSRPC